MKSKDFTNKKINMLSVIKKAKSKNKRTYWLCKCDCGKEIEVMTQDLTYKTKYSCGCTRKPKKKGNYKYPNKIDRLYTIWKGMKYRCYKPNSKSYNDYGGRGIKMCEEWIDFNKFQLWALDNGYDKKLVIDRIDNNKNYEPSNCRWVTIKENNLNKRNIIKINYNNKIICLKDYCKINNISYRTAIEKRKKGINIWEKN